MFTFSKHFRSCVVQEIELCPFSWLMGCFLPGARSSVFCLSSCHCLHWGLNTATQQYWGLKSYSAATREKTERLSRQTIYLQFRFWSVLACCCKSACSSTSSFSFSLGSLQTYMVMWAAGCASPQGAKERLLSTDGQTLCSSSVRMGECYRISIGPV